MPNSASNSSTIASSRARIGLDQFGGGADILFGGEAAEDRGFLRQIADAQPGAAVHRKAGDVMAVHLDGAGIGRDQAGDHVEAGGLAGAVGTQQAHHFAAVHRQADRAHHGALVEAFADAGDHQTLAAFDHARPRCRGIGGISGRFGTVFKGHAKIMPVCV